MLSSLVDYKFRNYSLRQYQFDQKEEDSDSSEEKFENEGTYFFGDEDGNVPAQVDMKKADEISEEYIKVMKKVYDRLKTRVESFRDYCFDD